jgi:threonine efflux protein
MLDFVHEYAAVLGGIAALWVAALVAPGPDFLLVTRISVTQGRVAALRAVLGIAAGIAVWGLAGFFGIHALFIASPWLYAALKLGGGAYLLLLGIRLLARRNPAGPEGQGAPANRGARAFRMGLLTNLANPKAPLFVSSLFAATLPQHPPTALGLAAVGVMFALTLGWYTFVARCLTIRRVAGAFTRFRRWIDRIAGLAFMAFGARLMLDRSA